MPGGDIVQFGYERDLDVSLLEERGELDHPTPDGWTSSRVLCRSGQSTLACLLHLVTSAVPPGPPLTLHHAGRYFESKALVDVSASASLSSDAAGGLGSRRLAG